MSTEPSKGGQKFYKELETLNALRNGIVHNRFFASDVTSADVLESIQLCRDVISLFLNQFNSSLDFSALGSYSPHFYKESDLVVRVRESAKKRVEKITDLYYEADLTFLTTERNGIIFPSEITSVQFKFKSLVLQVCGLDYVRYGTEKSDKASQLCPYEPSWQNGNLFALKLNLNFYEIARDFENILIQKEARLKGLIENLVAEKYCQMLKSWERLDFVDRISISRLFAHLFDLSIVDPSDKTSALNRLLVNAWGVVAITASSPISFISLESVSKLDNRRVVLIEHSNPSEISLLARAAHKLGFLNKNTIIVLPESLQRGSFLSFAEKFLSLKGVECASKDALRELTKEIGLKHKDRNLAEGSDYALIATGCSFLEYAAEMINDRPHINGDHWFSKEILSLAWTLPQEQGAEFLYFIENINETLEGRHRHFANINNLREELQKLLNQIGIAEGHENLLSVSENDFPPSFFKWNKIFKGVDELFTSND